MTTLFIDESKSAGYIVVAAVVTDADASTMRKALKRLVLPGQRRLHFSRESDSRRKVVLSLLTDLGVRAHVVISATAREMEAREECLAAVLDIAQKHGHRNLFLERDESIEKADRRMLFDGLTSRGLRERIRYDLQSPHSEPLLWIPDAIAWSHAKGGDWRRRIEPLVIDVTTTGG